MAYARGPVLYVHLAADGGILVIDGATGRSAWVVHDELMRRLEAIRARGGAVLLSRDDRGESALASATFADISASGSPVTDAQEIHPDAIRAGGATTLMFAAHVGAIELARDLLQRGADLSAQDSEGFSALMYAANGGQEEMVDLLERAGAEVNQTDRDGSTALMFAAQHGQARIVKKLLASGADVRARRGDGLTALEFAAQNGHDRCAAILLAVEQQVS